MTTTDRTADATIALLAALRAGGYTVETVTTGAVIIDGQHIDSGAWDRMAMSWDGTADGLEDLGWEQAADAMRDDSTATYRVIVGERGNKQGHVTEGIESEGGARVLLAAALQPYKGDGWGRVEVRYPGETGWRRLGE